MWEGGGEDSCTGVHGIGNCSQGVGICTDGGYDARGRRNMDMTGFCDDGYDGSYDSETKKVHSMARAVDSATGGHEANRTGYAPDDSVLPPSPDRVSGRRAWRGVA